MEKFLPASGHNQEWQMYKNMSGILWGGALGKRVAEGALFKGGGFKR